MFEPKDASKCDERRVKNTSNPLTRKSKGEIHKMGERCLLKTFFVIGLMLLTAMMLSGTAMAAPNDGEGKVTVKYGVNAQAIADFSTTAPIPLRAASKTNILQFTYTAFEDVANDSTTTVFGTTTSLETDVEGSVDSNDIIIDMGGGRVRIALPWSVSKKSVTITDRATDDATTGNSVGPMMDGVIYKTDGDGNLDKTVFSTDAKKKTANDTVEFGRDNEYILVNLGSEWARAKRTTKASAERSLVIQLGDVTTGIPRKLDQSPTTGALRRLMMLITSLRLLGITTQMFRLRAVPVPRTVRLFR